jgi:hypothetical protein
MKFHTIQALGKNQVLKMFQKMFGYVVVAPSNFLKLCSLVYREACRQRAEVLEALEASLKLAEDVRILNDMAAKYGEPTPEQKAHNKKLAYFDKKLDAVKGNKVLTAQFQKLKSDWLASAV